MNNWMAKFLFHLVIIVYLFILTYITLKVEEDYYITLTQCYYYGDCKAYLYSYCL